MLQAFAVELETVRESGLAIEREEFIRGASCMAAPVTNNAGQVIGSVARLDDPRPNSRPATETSPSCCAMWLRG